MCKGFLENTQVLGALNSYCSTKDREAETTGFFPLRIPFTTFLQFSSFTVFSVMLPTQLLLLSSVLRMLFHFLFLPLFSLYQLNFKARNLLNFQFLSGSCQT